MSPVGMPLISRHVWSRGKGLSPSFALSASPLVEQGDVSGVGWIHPALFEVASDLFTRGPSSRLIPEDLCHDLLGRSEVVWMAHGGVRPHHGQPDRKAIQQRPRAGREGHEYGGIPFNTSKADER